MRRKKIAARGRKAGELPLAPKPKPKPKRCAVQGCQIAPHGKGLCVTHYRRLERGEDLTAPIITDASLKPLTLRLTRARIRFLKAQALRMGFPSIYSLTSAIINAWVPPARAIIPTPLRPAQAVE